MGQGLLIQSTLFSTFLHMISSLIRSNIFLFPTYFPFEAALLFVILTMFVRDYIDTYIL